MKKTVLSFVIAMAMVLAMPAALFASDNLVNPDGSNANQIKADKGAGTDWAPATVWDVIEDAMLTAASAVDPSIVTEEENNVVVYGDNEVVGGDLTPVSVSTSSAGSSRYSSTSGNVSAYASFNRTATKASCTITLQEKYNGSWRTATGLSVKSYIKTVYNSSSISAAKTFTLKSGTVYRAKISFSDTNSSGTCFKTIYTGSF